MKGIIVSLANAALLLASAVSGAPPARPPPPPTPVGPAPAPEFFNNVTIFQPPASWTNKAGAYGRSVMLNQNCEKGIPTILATSAYSPPDGPYLQIFQSKDYGKTWTAISKNPFAGNKTLSGGTILQPFLFEISQPFGKYPPGTVLLSGNRIATTPPSTNIQLYASTDKGYTWEFVSTVVASGPPNTDNGAPCVWEPFILTHANQFAVYFSDQSDPKFGQKLSHRLSTDLMKWSGTMDDITNANYTLRPGMITIAEIAGGKWMASYEMGLDADETAPYKTHYRIANSPFEFLHAKEIPLKTNTGGFSSAGPYTVWTPAGGPQGTIVVSDSTYDQLFINRENGAPGHWLNVTSGHGVGYTRSLMVLPGHGGKYVQLYNGGAIYARKDDIFTVGDYLVPGAAAVGPLADGPSAGCKPGPL